MKAKKGNKAYQIEPREMDSFQSAGYDIYDDNGVIIKYGAGKTVSLEKYMALVKENAKLKEQVATLADKLDKWQAEQPKKKKKEAK